MRAMTHNFQVSMYIDALVKLPLATLGCDTTRQAYDVNRACSHCEQLDEADTTGPTFDLPSGHLAPYMSRLDVLGTTGTPDWQISLDCKHLAVVPEPQNPYVHAVTGETIRVSVVRQSAASAAYYNRNSCCYRTHVV